MTLEKAEISFRKVLDNKLLCALFINAIFFAFALMFGTLAFETNDDRDISNLLSNVYGGTDSAYAVFINIILGYFFEILYKCFPIVNWYVIVSLVFSFCSLAIIVYCVLSKTSEKLGIVISVLVMALFYQDSYVDFQFTKNASLYIAAGFLLILCSGLGSNNKKDDRIEWGKSICGMFFMVLGAMFRYQSFLGAIPFILIAVVSCVFRTIYRGESKKKLLRSLIPIVIAMICIVGTRYFHLWKYESNSEWKYYREYNEQRAGITDYGSFPFYEYEDDVHDAGVLVSDCTLMLKWTYADPDIYSLEHLKNLNEVVEKNSPKVKYISLDIIGEFFDTLVETNEKHGVLFAICFMVLIYIFMVNKEYMLEIVSVLLVIIGECYGFVAMGRVVYRAVYGTLLLGSLLLIYYMLESRWNAWESKCIKKMPRHIREKLFYMLLIGVLVMGMPGTLRMFSKSLAYEPNTVYAEFLDEVQKNKDKLYLVDRPTLTMIEENYSPYKVVQEGAYENISVLGGWLYPTPINNLPLERFGIKNPMQALSNNQGNVYLIDGVSYERKKAFIQKHYEKKLHTEIVKESDLYTIYYMNKKGKGK